MRRGLLQDLANTPTQIACGWRLYGDLQGLEALSGSKIAIDLLEGTASINGEPLSPPLALAGEVQRWMRQRHDRDGVPADLVRRATLTLEPRTERRGLVVSCSTRIETFEATFTSSDIAR